jgi:hypothetical protein
VKALALIIALAWASPASAQKLTAHRLPQVRYAELVPIPPSVPPRLANPKPWMFQRPSRSRAARERRHGTAAKILSVVLDIVAHLLFRVPLRF